MKSNNRTVKVGIMPREEFQQYLVDVARGKRTIKRDTPRVWFSSYESMFQVLNSRNIALLGMIRSRQPDSITQLAEISGRKLSNLSRTLKNFENAGLLTWETSPQGRGKKPVVTAESLDIQIDFSVAV